MKIINAADLAYRILDEVAANVFGYYTPEWSGVQEVYNKVYVSSRYDSPATLAELRRAIHESRLDNRIFARLTAILGWLNNQPAKALASSNPKLIIPRVTPSRSLLEVLQVEPTIGTTVRYAAAVGVMYHLAYSPDEIKQIANEEAPHFSWEVTHRGLEGVVRPEMTLRPSFAHAAGVIPTLWTRPMSFNWGEDRLVSLAKLSPQGRHFSETQERGVDSDMMLFAPDFSNVLTLEEVNATIRQYCRDRIRALRGGTGGFVPQTTVSLRSEADINKAADGYDTFRRAKALAKDEYIATLPVVEVGQGIKSSRRWGIEVETGAGRDLSGVPEQWDSKGDGSLESAYNTPYTNPEDCEEADHREEIRVIDETTGRPHWMENPDYMEPDECSVRHDWEDNYDDADCVELVSPILSSFHSRGLRQITDDLEGAPITHSAGVHVHVEAKDLTPTMLRELLLSYDYIEHLIEPSYRRRERGYCKRRSARELLRIANQIKQDPNINIRDIRKGDRYVTVNLLALDYHGTVEFRAMGPVYNYDHLIRWAMFCREMVNTVRNGARAKQWAKVNDWAGVISMFERYGVEYNQAIGKVPSEVGAEVMAA